MGSPQVYTRERLVNDRYDEANWLQSITLYLTQKFGPTPVAPLVEDERYADYLQFRATIVTAHCYSGHAAGDVASLQKRQN